LCQLKKKYLTTFYKIKNFLIQQDSYIQSSHVYKCYVQAPKVFCKMEGMRRKRYERTYSETMSRR